MKPQLINLDFVLKGDFLMKEITAPYFINTHHFHDDYELVYVVESSGKRIIGNSVGNFKKHDMVLVSPNLPHAWFNDREYYDNDALTAKSIVTYFRKNWIEKQLLDRTGGEKFKTMLDHASRGIKITGKTNRRIAAMLDEALHAPELLKAAQILMILHELSETTEFELLADAHYVNSYDQHEAMRINQVYEYVMKNFTSEIKLATVADMAHMSPNAFSRYFKSRTQKTFSLFVNEIRIGHACKLLQSEDFTMSQICYASGFQSMTNFTKFFKRFIKKSPLRYRKDIIELNAAYKKKTM
ncbi:AraC family transcriptional regulator [Parapedobacter soli]|uniref:AraC family transcriptional regulator n=1 Tax=Parapedobacter soli TaxID=416955 RepID=UPI0021C7329A|nr:AraC family transcriptional regulator [Parapedobacter soli]